jgi:hypothetical protein
MRMWTTEQRQRLGLENAILKQEGFDQFTVYWDKQNDTYYASGVTPSSSGRNYGLHISIPSGFPDERPPMYVTEPFPLLLANGNRVSSMGTSHDMHTLAPSSNGLVQLCHWRPARWHSGIKLQQVFLKGIIWIEAYEQHLATGRPLAEFVSTMAERA